MLLVRRRSHLVGGDGIVDGLFEQANGLIVVEGLLTANDVAEIFHGVQAPVGM